MESPKITHLKLKALLNIKDVAYNRIFENYLQLDLKGPKKLIDVESTDQESVIQKFGGGMPFPGMVYVFLHLNETNLGEIENAKTGKLISFHDFTPVLFCTSFNPILNLVKGLNLMLLPSQERLKFFEAYWEYYKDFFNRIEEKTEYNEIAINKEYQLSALIGKNPELFKSFNSMQDAYFEYAYRSYNLKNIAKFRMIEYEQWKYIPFLDARQSFKNSNLQEIYRTYKINKHKTY